MKKWSVDLSRGCLEMEQDRPRTPHWPGIWSLPIANGSPLLSSCLLPEPQEPSQETSANSSPPQNLLLSSSLPDS